MADSRAANLIPAATLVLLRDGPGGLEILMLQRSQNVGFLKGMWVFPGGRVDVEDSPGDVIYRARSAAIRETREETGLCVDPESLCHIAHWTAPVESPRRYATWFFVAPMLQSAEAVADGMEIVACQWCSADHALRCHAQGSMLFLPPTFVTLEWLTAFDSTAQAMQGFSARKPVVFKPKMVMNGGLVCNLYEEDSGYESEDINAQGRRHRFWMDDEDGWRYERSLLEESQL